MVSVLDLPLDFRIWQKQTSTLRLVMYQGGQVSDQLKEEMSTEHIQPSEHGSAFKHQNNSQ